MLVLLPLLLLPLALQRPPVSFRYGATPQLRRQSSKIHEVEEEQRYGTPVMLKDGSSPQRTYDGQMHWVDPPIVTWDNFLSEEECEHLISLARPNMQRANVTDDFSGHVSAGRTNDNAWLVHDRDQVVWEVIQRVSKTVGLPSTNAENLQVIHYEEGEQYTRHYDAYDHETIDGDRTMKDGGNRVVTAILYLV